MTTYYHTATDKYVNPGDPFTLAGIQYPANWLELASADDKEAAGLTEVSTSGTPGDSKFFNITEQLVNGVRVITNTPKAPEMIAAVDARAVEEIKDRVRKMREPVINRLNGVADRLARKGDSTVRALADDAIETLLTITHDLPTEPSAAELTVFGRYLAIREALPEGLKNTFAGLDL